MKYEHFSVQDYGFAGHLVAPETDTKTAVIVISGGEKSIIPGIKLAEKFALNGLIGLSVTLFGAEGLPQSPDRIPTESFEKAAQYLREVRGVRSISLYGISMASIFAVLTAKYVPDIYNVVIASPTHVPFEGTTDNQKIMTGHSVATHNGVDIPFVRPNFSAVKPKSYSYDKRAGRKVMGMWSAFETAYENKAEESNAWLGVEKLHSRILLIAGECDEAWNSAYSVNYIKARLDAANYAYDYKAIVYPKASHLIGVMPDRKLNKGLYRALPIIGLFYKSFSAQKKECMAALEQSEAEILRWIKDGSGAGRANDIV